MKEAGVRLKQLRRKKEITQEQVAAELNISVDTLRKNEQGIRGMSVELLDIYADYYNVDITSMKEVPEQLRKLRRQYLRYQQAEIIYSISHKKLFELASDAGALYRIDGTVLINRDIFDAYLEPVSYTHLDVYKRQPWCCCRLYLHSAYMGI